MTSVFAVSSSYLYIYYMDDLFSCFTGKQVFFCTSTSYNRFLGSCSIIMFTWASEESVCTHVHIHLCIYVMYVIYTYTHEYRIALICVSVQRYKHTWTTCVLSGPHRIGPFYVFSACVCESVVMIFMHVCLYFIVG